MSIKALDYAELKLFAVSIRLHFLSSENKMNQKLYKDERKKEPAHLPLAPPLINNDIHNEWQCMH